MRIYIFGSPGSGKTTLANQLSKKLNIKAYELDKVIHDDNHDHKKRTKEEIDEIFHNIIKEKSWIIEDVGRKNFERGRDLADIIYYIKLKKTTLYFRIITRWIKQKIHILPYNYPPTLKQLIELLKITSTYLKKESEKIKQLQKEKVVILNRKRIKTLIKN